MTPPGEIFLELLCGLVLAVALIALAYAAEWVERYFVVLRRRRRARRWLRQRPVN